MDKSTARSWKDIRAVLRKTDSNEVLKLVGELYGLHKENRDFLHARYLNDADALAPYKETIARHLSPAEPWKNPVKISQARKAISDYRKAVGDPENLAELMLYYVECGIGYIQEWEDVEDAYYQSIFRVFTDGIDMLHRCDQDVVQRLLPRFEAAVQSTTNMAWGFHDDLLDFLINFAPQSDD